LAGSNPEGSARSSLVGLAESNPDGSDGPNLDGSAVSAGSTLVAAAVGEAAAGEAAAGGSSARGSAGWAVSSPAAGWPKAWPQPPQNRASALRGRPHRGQKLMATGYPRNASLTIAGEPPSVFAI
jgi:hypothetical protein